MLLKEKLGFVSNGISMEKVEQENELREVLLGLGYKDKEISSILVKVDKSLTIEEQVKEALKMLLK